MPPIQVSLPPLISHLYSQALRDSFLRPAIHLQTTTHRTITKLARTYNVLEIPHAIRMDSPKVSYKLNELDFQFISALKNLNASSKTHQQLQYENMGKYYRELDRQMFLQMGISNFSFETTKVSIDKKNPSFVTFEIRNNLELVQQLYKEKQFCKITRLLKQGDTVFLYKGKVSLVPRPHDTEKNINVISGTIDSVSYRPTKEDTPWGHYKVRLQVHNWYKNSTALEKTLSHLNSLNATVSSATVAMLHRRMEESEIVENVQSVILNKREVLEGQVKEEVEGFRFFNKRMNDDQKKSVKNFIFGDSALTLLNSPRGCGSTTIIVECIQQLLKSSSFTNNPIIVVSPSNKAIDDITLRLHDLQVKKILRVVSDDKEVEYDDMIHLRKICLHTQVRDMLCDDSIALERQMRKLYKWKNIEEKDYTEYSEDWNKAATDIMQNNKVILTTNLNVPYLIKSLPKDTKFPVLLMDKSNLADEASSLTALSLPGLKRFLMVGDCNQLNSVSDVRWLEKSLYNRLYKLNKDSVLHLTIQHTTNPEIQSLLPISSEPCSQNYSTTSELHIPGIEKAVQFIDIGTKYQAQTAKADDDTDFKTMHNQGEANAIVRLINRLLDTTLNNELESGEPSKIQRSQISVVTPYRAQLRCLIQTLESDVDFNRDFQQPVPTYDIETTFNTGERDSLNLNTRRTLNFASVAGVTVSTVEGFQACSNDIVVLSTVKSTKRKIPQNETGFTKDPIRMNVMLSRANKALFIVGSKPTLESLGNKWSDLMVTLSNDKKVLNASQFNKICGGPKDFTKEQGSRKEFTSIIIERRKSKEKRNKGDILNNTDELWRSRKVVRIKKMTKDALWKNDMNNVTKLKKKHKSKRHTK